MLARQRHEHILRKIRREGAVRVADLVDELGVSDMTIRRDLTALADAGMVVKVHGGATRIPDGSAFEPGFAAKLRINHEIKHAIAGEAAKQVQAGMALAMSAGTTTYAVAEHLIDVPGLTVVTNSVRVADVLHERGRRDQTVILTGGERTPSDALVGPITVAMLRNIHVDMTVLGVHGMAPEVGFTTPNLSEAEADRALIAAGGRLMVVADHTKWGVVGISTIAPLGAADVVVTDTDIDPEALDALRSAATDVVLARLDTNAPHTDAEAGRAP